MGERGAFTRAKGGGYVLRIAPAERALVGRLLDELAALLAEPDDGIAIAAATATVRLFPVVHPDDAEREAEYQRLMRDELVASRLAAVGVVKAALAGSGKKVTFDEGQLGAFMQAVNSVRLVLGTVLGVSEEDDVEELDEHVAEYQLYAYLSWLLDSAVLVASTS